MLGKLAMRYSGTMLRYWTQQHTCRRGKWKLCTSSDIRLAPKGLKMNRDRGKGLSPFGSGPSRELKRSRPTSHTPRENRGQETTGHHRQQVPATSLAPWQPTPPEGPPPAIRRPTPSLRRSRQLASTTPPRALDTPTVELFKNCTLIVLYFLPWGRLQ